MNLTTVIKSPLQRTDCQGYDGQMFHILQANHLCLVWRIPKESCQLRNEVEVAWSFWSMLIQLWWSTHILQLFFFKINFHFSSGDGFFWWCRETSVRVFQMCCFRKFLFCARERWTLHVFCKCLLSPVRTHTRVYIPCCLPVHPHTHVQVIYTDLSMDFKLVYACSTRLLVPVGGKKLVQNPKGQHVRTGVKKPKPAWTRFLACI